MSSTLFEVKLHPDAFLSTIVLVTGVVTTSLGMVLIVTLDIAVLWRWLTAAVWLADCSIELHRLASGTRKASLLVLDSDGGIRVATAAGNTLRATLLSGSVVGRRLAWIRVQTSDDWRYAGLFTRQRVDAGDWHGLQLIWRQARAAFGHPASP